MQTRALKTLTKIAQIGSFIQTADHLHMTLSAVSMQMKSLETELGIILFDRSFRPPQLTPIGRTIASHASTLLVTEEKLVGVCNPGNHMVGQFRIGFVTTASVRLLPDFLKTAAKLAPKAKFSLETGLSEMLEAKVLSGQLDAAIVTASNSIDSNLQYEVLYDEPLVFAIPIEKKSLSFDALVADTTFLQFMPSTGIGKLIATQILEIRAGRQDPTITLNNVETIVECVKKGIGFTMLPRPDIERYADASIHIMCPKRISLSRKLVLTTARGSVANQHVAKLKLLLDT
ncbi:MAG: LysR family transcriptional regulator [Rhizobiaceae bacterium]